MYGKNIAEVCAKPELEIGDTVEIRDADMNTCTVAVSGIFDNYVNNLIVVSKETYSVAFGEWKATTALLSVDGGTQDAVKLLTNIGKITSVSQLSATREGVDNVLSCLNYIIWLIVLFSGALAFIVIFNLTNSVIGDVL